MARRGADGRFLPGPGKRASRGGGFGGFNVQLIGPWKLTKVGLSQLGPKIRLVYRRTALREGHRLRNLVVKGIRSGAPGGKTFAPLSPATLAVRALKGRGGTKPLIVTGGLRNSITVREDGDSVFVGILKSAKNGGENLANVGEIHEFGKTFAVQLTTKSKRFLAMAFRRAGILESGSGGADGSKGGVQIAIITIPPRPFLAPVFEQEQPKIRKRFELELAKEMAKLFR